MSTTSGRGPAFPATPPGAVGYCRSEVDRFLRELRQALGQDPPAITAAQVAGSRFHVARFGRRYAMPAVDDYLDGAESTLRARGADGEPDEPALGHPRATWWVYATAAALIAVIVAFVLTQL